MAILAQTLDSPDTTLVRAARTQLEDTDSPASGHALTAIYHSESPRLLRYLRRRVGADLVPDIAQEVFTRAAASPQLLNLVNPGGFLCRIAQNILIDQARIRRRRIDPLPLIEAADAPCAPEQEHEIEASDLQLTVERALNRLPDRTRRIFVMHRFEEMAYREIRYELGISMAAVEYHMGKALAHVRGAIEAVR